MRHVMFALFENPERKEAALRDLEAKGISRERYHLLEHEGRIDGGGLDLAKSDRGRGLALGALAGVILGGMIGALISSFAGVPRIGPLPAGAPAALIGVLLGGLTGALMGARRVNGRLMRLSRELDRGKFLVTIEPEGISMRYRLRKIFHRHGAQEVGAASAFPASR